MGNEAVTQDQFYELKEFVESEFSKVESKFDKVESELNKVESRLDKVESEFSSRFDKLEDSMNKLRTWTVSAFFGAVVVIGTLIGAYAMFLLRLPQS